MIDPTHWLEGLWGFLQSIGDYVTSLLSPVLEPILAQIAADPTAFLGTLVVVGLIVLFIVDGG